MLCVFQTNLGGSGLDPCFFLKELMRASESSSIHLPYGDKKFWLNTAKCAVIYHSGGGIVSRKNNPPSGLRRKKVRFSVKHIAFKNPSHSLPSHCLVLDLFHTKATFKGYFYPSLMSYRNEPGLLQGKGQGMGLRVELMHPLRSGCVSCTISSLAAKFHSQQLSARKIEEDH